MLKCESRRGLSSQMWCLSADRWFMLSLSAEWRGTVSEPPRSLCHAFTSRNISLLSNEHKSVTSLINRIRAHRQSPLFYRHPLTCNCQAAAWSVQIPPKMFALFRRVSHLRFARHRFICLAIFWIICFINCSSNGEIDF